MRAGVSWALGATLLASVIAIWNEEAPRVVPAAENGYRTGAENRVLAPFGDDGTSEFEGPLPTHLPRLQIEEAKRDIFTPYKLPAESAVAFVPVLESTQPARQDPLPLPQAPVIALRYLGSMITPEDVPMVFLARGDEAVTAVAGQQLDEGYVVESITAEAVKLVYPPLQTRVLLPIPLAATQ